MDHFQQLHLCQFYSIEMHLVPVLYIQPILSMLGNPGSASQLGVRSEVGVFTGEGPESHLFVPLCDDVVPTERPARASDQCFRTFKAGWGNWHDCSPFLMLKRLEADPENTELVLGCEHLPSGELEWHLDHRSDVFIKLGKQPGLGEPLELERSTDVNNNSTQLWEVARTDGCCRIQLDLLVNCCHCFLVSTVEFNR